MKTTVTLEFDSPAEAQLALIAVSKVFERAGVETSVADKQPEKAAKAPKPAATPPASAPAPAASAPATASPSEAKVEYATLQKAVLELARTNRKAAEEIIAGYGFSKFTELAPGQWAEVLAKVTEALGAGK